jgi:hypothetical protein
MTGTMSSPQYNDKPGAGVKWNPMTIVSSFENDSFAGVGVPPLGGLSAEPDRLKPGHQQADFEIRSALCSSWLRGCSLPDQLYEATGWGSFYLRLQAARKKSLWNVAF